MEYAFAVATTLTALLIRFALDPALGDHLPYFTFFVAIVATAWFTRVGPSLTAVLLGGLLSNWFFVPPRGALLMTEPRDVVGYATYFAVSLVILGFGYGRRRAQERTQMALRALQQELSERDRVQADLREAHERLARVLDVQTVGVMFWDLTTGCLVDANDTFLKMMGYSRADIEACELTWQKFTPPEYHAISEAEVKNFQATGRVGPYEKEYFRKDGTRQWLLFAGSALGDNRCVEFCIDITDRKRAEEAVRESEERFRTLADNISQFAWMADATGWLFWYNQRWFTYTGTTLEEMQGWGWKKVHHPEYVDRVEAKWREAHRTGQPWEDIFPLRSKDGEYRWFLSRAMPIRDATGEIVRWFGTNTDITKQREIEAALRASEERLRLAHQATGIGTFDWDLRTSMNTWSAELEAMYGLQPGTFPQTQAAWENLIHPEDRPSAIQLVQQAFKTRQPVEGEWRVIWPDQTLHWIAGRWQVFSDASGEPIRMTGVNMDITARKLAEEQIRALLREAEARERQLRETQAQLVQSEKLASLGEMAAGVAHELNNPLNNIGLAVGNARESLLMGGDLRRMPAYLDQALSQVDRASAIIEQLRAFARRAPTVHSPMCLHPLVENAVSYMQEHFRTQGVSVQCHLTADTDLVLGNAIQLEQIVVNLLSNARDALGDRQEKTITIRTRQVGDHIELQVNDTGAGMPADIVPRIFDPFFTTKDHGTGLGLSISYGLIMEHQGTIRVDSREGKGTNMVVSLPLALAEQGLDETTSDSVALPTTYPQRGSA